MRTGCLFVGLCLLASSAFAANPSEFLVYNFDRYNNGLETNSNDVAGRLYVPGDYDPSQEYVLVTHLHGLGETGANSPGGINTSQVNNNINNLYNAMKAQGNVLFYAPQAWAAWHQDSLDAVANQIAKIARDYNIDMDRMYMTGLSMGGEGALAANQLYPHVFPAVVATAASAIGPIAIVPSQQTDIPVWLFHATNDGTVNISVARNRVNGVRASKGQSNLTFPLSTHGNGTDVNYPGSTGFYDDGTFRYTEYQSGGHGIWSTAYAETAMHNWLLSKTREIPDLQVGQTMLFDIGFTRNDSPSGGQFWNSTAYGLYSIDGPVKSFAKTTAGIGTKVTLDVTDRFNGEFADTINTTLDAWFVTPSDPGAVKLLNLVAGGKYEIELFAARASNNGTTRFIVEGEQKDLYHYQNVSNTALFEEVTADVDGTIEIIVQAAPGSSNGYLNWISIEALVIPEPGSVILMGLAGVGLVLRRRTR